MSNNHIITKDVGNLRGFSTDSSFTRPPNVASIAENIQRNPDGTLGPRRGYQCKAADIGGMGTGNYDNPFNNTIETLTVNDDGNLYKLLKKQIYLYYDGRVDGSVTGATQANPCEITAPSHGLSTGTEVILRNIPGMVQLNDLVYTITVTGINTFTLDGIDSTGFDPYGTGSGEWAIAFTDYRYLVFTIFTDPRFLSTNLGWSVAPWSTSPWGAPSGESITCQITVKRAAQIDGNQTNVNTINVKLGHELATSDTVIFTTSDGKKQQRLVTATTASSITVDGYSVTVLDDVYIDQFFDIPFRKGFDVTAPFEISTFLTQITSATTGIEGLQVVANGDTDKPAAFIEIIEPTVINDGTVYTINYCYWEAVNKTVPTTFPGSANPTFQNSEEFENASFATYDDVAYIANGWDRPQKYDGQTAYRVGMPTGIRPTLASSGAGSLDDGNYTYLITYEQVDAIGHVAEGPPSPTQSFTVTSGPLDIDVTVQNLASNSGWNTNGALSDGAATTVYGPDVDGYLYHLLGVQASPHTMKIGDTAFYTDRVIAQSDGASSGNTMTVDSGHGVEVNDFIWFSATSGETVQRFVTAVTSTEITFDGESVTWSDNEPILANKHNLVYGNIAIVDGQQNNVNTITVLTNHTIQVGDLVTFTDSSSRVQRREVTAIGGTSITIDGPPVTVTTLLLIVSETIRTDQFYVRRPSGNTTGATLSNNDPISNNLRINIYRTIQNGDLFYLLRTLPNDSISGNDQTFTDDIEAGQLAGDITDVTTGGANCDITSVAHGLETGMQVRITEVGGTIEVNDRNYTITKLTDDTFRLDGVNPAAFTAYTAGGRWEVIFGLNNELGVPYSDPDRLPDPPPISKYVLTYGNQLLYAGGERNTAENSDNVFFSEGNQPESVPEATNFFTVPSQNDDISGIGQAGTTLIVFKNKSANAIIGDLLTSQFQVNPISPGTNIGCVAHATIQPVGSLLYFLHTNGVYAITENQFYPTDPFGNPVPLSTPIDDIFRTENYLPQTKLVFKRAVATNYTKDNQYLVFIPAEDTQTTQRTANQNSILLCYDYQAKNWFKWTNMNAAGGIFSIDDDLYFQERRFSGLVGNTANLYKQHRFYRLVDYADHTSSMRVEWRSSWQDLGLPEVRKKFVRCMLLINRVSSLLQFNNPNMMFSSYLDRLPNRQDTIADITTVNNQRNASWSISPWGFSIWSGYQDSFARVNLRQGTVSKSMQVGFKLVGINMSFKLSGLQLEAVPEFRRTFVR